MTRSCILSEAVLGMEDGRRVGTQQSVDRVQILLVCVTEGSGLVKWGYLPRQCKQQQRERGCWPGSTRVAHLGAPEWLT